MEETIRYLTEDFIKNLENLQLELYKEPGSLADFWHSLKTSHSYPFHTFRFGNSTVSVSPLLSRRFRGCRSPMFRYTSASGVP